MLVIRDAQLDAFQQLAVDSYVLEMADHCRRFSPRLCQTLREEQLHTAIRHGLRLAERSGFSQRGPVRLYLDMMILLGSGFDSDPQYPWVAEIVTGTAHLSEMQRAEALHARVVDYLAAVDGAHNLHTLKALSDLAALHARGVELHADTLEADLLRLMTQIHPRKVAATGEPALRHLIADGAAKARTRYGFVSARSLGLLSVLMFAFGHQCDTDPLLPWIARTLANVDRTEPDVTAARLERRALVWLTAVLANAASDS